MLLTFYNLLSINIGSRSVMYPGSAEGYAVSVDTERKTYVIGRDL